MRENRTYGLEGGEPDYPASLPLSMFWPSQIKSQPVRAFAMSVGSLANVTGDAYALRASERATLDLFPSI